jgi:ubiquitin carboxyl-terminal hydrolase 4/11/15
MHAVFARLSEPGLCGITNIGNSCYLAAAMQCLAHLDVICDYFVKEERWKTECNWESPKGTHCEVVEAFAGIVKDLWNGENFKVSPRPFKFTFAKFAGQFGGSSQQDAGEFLTVMLDLVHEDLNRARDYSVLEPVFGNGDDDEEVSARAWQRHKSRNDSFIVDTFHGQLRSRNLCPLCGKSTIVFDPFCTLTTPIPVPKAVSPPFTFVPFDVTRPRVQMRVTVIEPGTIPEYMESISTRIKRRIHSIVFAERAPNETVPRWRQTLIQGAACYAFEIPPHSPDSVFVPVRLLVPRLGAAADVELDGIFLVELPSMNATESDVLAACEAHFSPLWRPTPADADISSELLDIESSLCEGRESFAAGERMRIRIITTPLDPSKIFDRDRKCKSVSSRAVQVVLNPRALSRDLFDWALLRHTVDDPEPCIVESRQAVDVESSLKMFALDQQLDMENRWFCPHCHHDVCATKQMNIWRLPPILILHFKRFMRTASSPMKIDTKIKCPLAIDLTPHLAGPQPICGCVYRMCGSIHHSGGLSGGHYVAHVLHSPSRKWYVFDDTVVKALSPSGHGADAYIVFYALAEEKKPVRRSDTPSDQQRNAFVPRILLPIVTLTERRVRTAQKPPKPRD